MSIAPWDWLRYFNQPVEVAIAGTGSAVQVLSADPMRVLIIFANVNTSSIWSVSTNPSVNQQSGMGINGNQGPFVLDYEHFGSLLTVPWYAIGQNIGTLTVITLSMSTWPVEAYGGKYDATALSDAIQRFSRRERHPDSTGQST
jgi:hypothetical protein